MSHVSYVSHNAPVPLSLLSLCRFLTRKRICKAYAAKPPIFPRSLFKTIGVKRPWVWPCHRFRGVQGRRANAPPQSGEMPLHFRVFRVFRGF